MKTLLLICAIFSLIGSVEAGFFSGKILVIESFDVEKLENLEITTVAIDYGNFLKQRELIINGKKPPQKVVWHKLSKLAFTQIESFLVSRGMDPDEIPIIKKNKIFTGMSDLAVYASLGKPKRVNASNYGSKTRYQLTYPGLYVYIENRVVTAWQRSS